MSHCLRASPTGWSSAADLGRDLQRFFGLSVADDAVRRGVRELARSGGVQVVVDDAGTVWHRIRPAASGPGDYLRG